MAINLTKRACSSLLGHADPTPIVIPLGSGQPTPISTARMPTSSLFSANGGGDTIKAGGGSDDRRGRRGR